MIRFAKICFGGWYISGLAHIVRPSLRCAASLSQEQPVAMQPGCFFCIDLMKVNFQRSIQKNNPDFRRGCS